MSIYWFGRQLRILSTPIVRCTTNVAAAPQRRIHRTALVCVFDARDKDHEKKEKALIVRHGSVFDEAAAKKSRDKKTFNDAVKTFVKRDQLYRRNHVEFIYAAMEKMEEFGVTKDRDTYKNLLELFPKGKMVVETMWQAEMMHYPKQQQCAIDLLDKMEDNGLIPDDAMGYQLLEIFGKENHAFRKYQRMMYWMPKFKNMNPYPVPYELPEDLTALAQLALKRMAVDLENRIQVFQASDVEGSFDKTFIASAQSPTQQYLLKEQPMDKAVFVEGGFPVWLRDKKLIYFILRAETSSCLRKFQEQEKQEDEDLFDWVPFLQEKPSKFTPVPVPSAHEQDDGTLLGMCITGTGSKDSLISWVKLLQKDNPSLVNLPVVFSLITPEAGLQVQQEKTEDKEVATS